MSAFTDQINAANGGLLTFGPGQYLVDQPLTVRSAVLLDPSAVVTVQAPITMQSRSAWGSLAPVKMQLVKAGNFNTFTIAGSDVSIEDVSIDDTAATGGWDFLLDTTSGLNRIDLRRIITQGSTGLITDNNAAGVAINLKLEDVTAYAHRGRGSYLSKAFAYVFLNRCTIDYIGTSNLAAANIPAWVFQNAQGLELRSVDVTGNANVGNMGTQYGFYFNNCQAIRLDTVMADNVGGFGLWFGNCQYVQGSTVNASQGGDIGFLIANGSKDFFIENFYAAGRKGLAGDHASSMFYTDGSTSDIRFGKGMTEMVSGAVFGGSAQSTISFTSLTNR